MGVLINSTAGDSENSFLIPTFKGDLRDAVLLTYGRILQLIAADKRSVYDIKSVIERVKEEFDLDE